MLFIIFSGRPAVKTQRVIDETSLANFDPYPIVAVRVADTVRRSANAVVSSKVNAYIFLLLIQLGIERVRACTC